MLTNAQAIVDVASYVNAAKLSQSPSNNGAVLYDGQPLSDAGPLYRDLGIPGVLIRPMVADESGNTDTDANRAFLSQLSDLWSHRLAGSGFFTAEQITKAVAVLGKGLMIVPTNATTIHNIDKTHPDGLYSPISADPSRSTQWDQITAQFKTVTTAYLKGELADAVAKGADLDADVAFWDSVAEEVKNLPGDVAGFAAKNILGAFAGIIFNPYVLGLGALALVGFIVYQRGSAKVMSLATGGK